MEAVTSLISAGADVNAVNRVRHGVCSISRVIVLCEMSSVSHYTCVSSHSALMVAARSGKTEVVSLLVKAGAICCHFMVIHNIIY